MTLMDQILAALAPHVPEIVTAVVVGGLALLRAWVQARVTDLAVRDAVERAGDARDEDAAVTLATEDATRRVLEAHPAVRPMQRPKLEAKVRQAVKRRSVAPG